MITVVRLSKWSLLCVTLTFLLTLSVCRVGVEILSIFWQSDTYKWHGLAGMQMMQYKNLRLPKQYFVIAQHRSRGTKMWLDIIQRKSSLCASTFMQKFPISLTYVQWLNSACHWSTIDLSSFCSIPSLHSVVYTVADASTFLKSPSRVINSLVNPSGALLTLNIRSSSLFAKCYGSNDV